MTCAHVLALIDAGPFADYPRAHLQAAWQHARQCDTCGPALEAATALTTGLSALPQSSTPPDLKAVVFARIARIEEALPTSAVRSATPNWSAWATVLGGLAAGLALVVSMSSRGVVPFDIAAPLVSGMTTGLVPMPGTGTGALVLAASLLLYAAGLCAPVGGRRRE
jgi:hypothetical protein